MRSEEHCLVLTTVPGPEKAERLAISILERRLAACVQIHPIRSLYIWEGAIQADPEYLLVMKTRNDLYDALESFILRNHDYEVPEVVRMPITGGSTAYLRWIDVVTSGPPSVSADG